MYKATNTDLQSRSGSPVHASHTEQGRFESQATKRTRPVTQAQNSHIRKKPKGRRGRKEKTGETPAEDIESRALKIANWSSMTQLNQTCHAQKHQKLTRDWRDKG